MTPQDFDRIDRWAHNVAHSYTKTCLGWATRCDGHKSHTDQCKELKTAIRSALIEAWNAALEEAALACDKVKDGSIYNAVDIEFDDDAGAVDVCAAAFRAMKLITGGR